MEIIASWHCSTGEKILSFPFNEKSNIYAKDLNYTKNGVEFSLVYNKKEYKTSALLLGFHNISNIVLCANICLSLGLSINEIISGIEKLLPSPHRLAIIPSSESLIVIDDAYNGSVEGAKAAMEVLASYKSKKVVITPGLVELGKEQFDSNKELGILMAQKTDYVIINGTTNYEAIFAGLKEGGMPEDKIFRAGGLKQAVTILADITEPGDVVLFENDLPDNYS